MRIKTAPKKSLKPEWPQRFFSIDKLCGCQHLDKVATFPKKKGKRKIWEIQAPRNRKISNMGERNAFFSYLLVLKLPGIQTSLELDFLYNFCSQGLVLPSMRHTWQSWEFWAVTGFNCYLEKCGRRLHFEVTEINQIAWTQLHRGNLMSVCAPKQRRLCGQFDTGIPDILPKLEWKDKPVIYKRGDKAAQRLEAGKRSKS